MKNIVLFGPPGAGKGTQAEKIVQKYAFYHISTGDVFRKDMQEQTVLGKKAQEFIHQGLLVPDELTIQMLEEVVEEQKNGIGFIFDGFPRTVVQADHLEVFLKNKNQKIDVVLGIELSEELLKNRLLERGKLSSRADDAHPQIIADRIAEYYKKTAPLKAYYQNKNLYQTIQGAGEITAVSESIFAILDRL